MKRLLPALFALTTLIAAATIAGPRLLRSSKVPPPVAPPARSVTVQGPSRPAAASVASAPKSNSMPRSGSYVLTFDDGPHPVHTPAILDWLKVNKIKATFFVLGENAKRYPDIVKRIAAEGHEIGNHTWDHQDLRKLKPAAVHSEIKRTHDLIVSLTGKAPVSFRPPYGAIFPSQRAVIEKEFGYRIVLWDADSLDWKLKSPEAVGRELRMQLKPGAIILAHDIHPLILPALEKLYSEWTRRGLTPAALAVAAPSAAGIPIIAHAAR